MASRRNFTDLENRHKDCLWAFRMANEALGTNITHQWVAKQLNRPLQWVRENWTKTIVPPQEDAASNEQYAFVGGARYRHTERVASYDVSPFAVNHIMPEPMIFITQQENGKFLLNKSVVALLQEKRALFSCIAIAGKYRTGKSFLLNQLMECDRGFAVGHTVQTKTKGIWLWMKPHPENPSDLLLLLDTEGTSDVEKSDEENDTKLLALTILLCNTMALNVCSVLDTNTFQQLEILTDFTEIIRTESGRRKEDGSAYGNYFPRLVFLLRDFSLEMKINERHVSEDEYLEHALTEKPGQSKKVKAANDTKDCIKRFFPNRTCRTLVKPTECEEDLKQLGENKNVDLKPAFIQQMVELRNLLLNESSLFMLDGYLVWTDDFVHIATEYVTALNNRKMPCIQSAATRLKTVRQDEIIQEMTKAYNTLMCEYAGDPVEEYVLRNVHRRAYQRALSRATSDRLFEGDDVARAKAEEALNSSYKEFVAKHKEERTSSCKQWLQACFVEVNEHIKENHYTNHGEGFHKYETDIESAKETYAIITEGGPISQHVLTEHMRLREGERAAIRNAAEVAGEKEEQLRLAKMRLQEEQARSSQLEEESNERLIKELERERQTYETTLSEIHVKFLVENERMQELLRESVEKIQNMRQEGEDKMEEIENVVREMNQEARRLRQAANNFGN